MIPLICGYDERELVGYHVFVQSVVSRSTMPVAFTPLNPINLSAYKEEHKDGTNAFTYSRFLTPWLRDFSHFAIFADAADMICLADIAELWDQRNPFAAVQVVKHCYATQHPRKYVGTSMEADNRDYPRKNWSSLMIINCAHYAWRKMNPETISKMTGEELHSFSFIDDKYIGELDVEWNWLADEFGENREAKILHWTAGIPAFWHYADAPHSKQWWDEHKKVSSHAN